MSPVQRELQPVSEANSGTGSSSKDAVPGSQLSRLRELREEFRADRYVDLEVPGYRGLLIARYRPVPWEILRKIARSLEQRKRDPEIELIVACNTLIHACDHMRIREGSDTKPILVSGQQITYDKALADILDLNAETPREVIRSTFPDPFAIVSHYGEFMEWQGEGDQQVDDNLASTFAADPT